MDAESIRSGRSDRSRLSQSAPSRNVVRRPHSSQHLQQQSGRSAERMTGEPLLRYGVESDTDRDDHRSSKMSRRHRHHLAESGRDKIAMKMFDDPLDDVTVITGATSECAYSLEDLRKDVPIGGKNMFTRSLCSKLIIFCGSLLVFLLCLISFASPIAMVILPKIPALNWDVDSCDPECESALLGIAFKLLILLATTWALFFRSSRATLPRLDPSKALVIFVVFLLIFSFWLFYCVRFFQKLTVTYLGVVLFSSSLVDSLLFVHYLAVILFELKRLRNRFAIKIVRSPDGVSKTYSVGQMTVQNLAVWCLDKYYTDFQSYNPYLEVLPKKLSGGPGAPAFKLYNVDGIQDPGVDDKNGGNGGRAFSVVSSSINGSRVGHNDKFYSEQEYERRVLRRKSRLQASAEEAFAHLKKIREDSGVSNGPSLNAQEAAQAIFPALVRPLQKYLRITRQQPKYSMENVLQHLSMCISYEMSSKAFLERYLHQGEVVWTESGWSKLKLTSLKGQIGMTCDNRSNDRNKKEPHSWVLTYQGLLNKTINDKCILKLSRCGAAGEALLITCDSLPYFDLVERPLDIRAGRFVLDMNAELSV